MDKTIRRDGGQLLITCDDSRSLSVSLDLPDADAAAAAQLAGCPVQALPSLASPWVDCPVALTLSLHRAVEAAAGIAVGGAVAELRRLLLCSEWLQNHTRHIYLLHAAALLGYANLREMAQDYPELALRGQRLIRIGNGVVRTLAGSLTRHSNLMPGGFRELPPAAAIRALEAELEWAQGAAEATFGLVARLPFRRFDRVYNLIALDNGAAYMPMSGNLRSLGTDVAYQALPRLLGAEPPVRVGPLARYAMHRDHLSERAKQLAADAGLDEACRNPFRSVVVRAVELVHVVDEALALVRRYQAPKRAAEPMPGREGEGYGCVSGPTGPFIYHCRVSRAGLIDRIEVLTPLMINRRGVERDLVECLQPCAGMREADLHVECEHLVRNYEPALARGLRVTSAPRVA